MCLFFAQFLQRTCIRCFIFITLFSKLLPLLQKSFADLFVLYHICILKKSLFSLHLIILKFEWVVEHTQCNSKHVRMHGRGLDTEESVVILYHVCRISATMTTLYHQFSQHLKN